MGKVMKKRNEIKEEKKKTNRFRLVMIILFMFNVQIIRKKF